MAPSSNNSSPSEILCDPLRQKFIDIIKSHEIFHPVDKVIMIEPEELKGEHMATATVYVRIEFEDSSIKPKNLFVKKFPNNAGHKAFTKQMRIMEKESAFFNDFLPKAREFCKKYKGCETMLDFFPKILYGDDEMVVLENVVLDDTFIMLCKEERQDLFTAKYTLSNLAKFHAANYAFIQEEGGGAEKFREDWELVCAEAFIIDNPMMESMFDNGINTCMSILKGHPVDGHEEATQTLVAFMGKTYPSIKGMLDDRGNKLNVLNHGDFWNNNMLFKKDPSTGKVNDHIFVDLQITRLGSPCFDLGYFLYTSVQPKVRRAHFDELIHHYFETFKSTLELFHQKCPLTFDEFLQDYKEKSRLGFFFNLSVISAFGAMKDIDIENMSEDPEKMMEQFNNAINNWVERNPDKAAEMSSEIIAVIKEDAKLREGIEL